LQVLAFFTDAGVPKTGLVPTVRIRDISDNTLVITDSTSSEVGDGWYKYDFIVYDSDKEYAIRFDGGPTLSNTDRYTSGTNDSFADDIADAVFEEQINEHLTAGSLGYVVDEVNGDLKRALGLLDENSSLDQQVYNTDHRLTSARKRIFTDSTKTTVLATYQITAVWSDQELTSYTMVRV